MEGGEHARVPGSSPLMSQTPWSGNTVETIFHAPKAVIYCGEGEVDTDPWVFPEIQRETFPESPWPRLIVSREDREAACRPWRRALIIKVLGKSMGFLSLKQRVKTLWQLQLEAELIDLGHGFLIARFWSKADYEKVLNGGPWMVMGHYLTVQKWRPKFKPSKECVNNARVWIRFPEVSLENYYMNIVTEMARKVGKDVRIDPFTSESRRGKFARASVEINLDEPLIPNIWVDDELVNVEYEGLHLICFSCGTYGHLRENCTSNVTGGDASTNHGQQPNRGNEVRQEIVEKQGPGEWMKPKPRQRRQVMIGTQAGTDNVHPANRSSNRFVEKNNGGSRFSALGNDESVEGNGDKMMMGDDGIQKENGKGINMGPQIENDDYHQRQQIGVGSNGLIVGQKLTNIQGDKAGGDTAGPSNVANYTGNGKNVQMIGNGECGPRNLQSRCQQGNRRITGNKGDWSKPGKNITKQK